MQNSTEPASNRSPSAQVNGVNTDCPSDMTARRRVLLKGLGRGAAVLAATVPIRTLAGQQCSASGMQSAMASPGPGGPPVCAVGFTPAYWGASEVHSSTKHSEFGDRPSLAPLHAVITQKSHGHSSEVEDQSPLAPLHAWPAGANPQSLCNRLLTKSALANQPTLFQVMNDDRFAGSDERHWICAWLNAKKVSNFPYMPEQVLKYYHSNINAEYNNTLMFFKSYMETRSA